MSSESEKKKRKDQIPVQVSPETKELLDRLKTELQVNMRVIVHAAVATFMQQPLYWRRRAVGQISEEEYEALQAAAAVQALQAPKRKRRAAGLEPKSGDQ